MQAVRFTLSGKTAFFKKPDVNVNTYFTYNNIHKVAILGILGAVIGLKGHIQQYNSIKNGENDYIDYPEFYSKLKGLKICIKPKSDKGYFTKKIQVFNNGVGYASKEAGGNLIVREQWIENPKWDIYILDDGTVEDVVFLKLKDYLIQSKCTYIPYLGKNDHPALIEKCEVVELKKVDEIEHIDSMFDLENVLIGEGAYDEEMQPYFFKEFSPVALSNGYNFYEFKELSYTNLFIEEVKEKDNLYKLDDEILAFM